jgi:hypothetical protein
VLVQTDRTQKQFEGERASPDTDSMLNRSRNLLRRQYARLKRLNRLGSLGITPRLTIAFIAVAALAAAANLFVENGVSIIEQQRQLASERSASDAQAMSALRASMDHAKQTASATQLLLALFRFDSAVHEHVGIGSASTASHYFDARRDLERNLDQYLAEGKLEAPQNISARIGLHVRTAEVLVRVLRARQVLLAQYSKTLETMVARVDASITAAGKTLGRTTARQPLLQLRTQLDALQVAFASPDALAEGRGVDGDTALSKAEQSLADTLQAHRLALQSQGAEWYQKMNADLALLAGTRTLVMQAGPRRAAVEEDFVRETRGLTKLLPGRADTVAGPADDQVFPATAQNPWHHGSCVIATSTQSLVGGLDECGGSCLAVLHLFRHDFQHRAARAPPGQGHGQVGARRRCPSRCDRRHPRARYSGDRFQLNGRTVGSCSCLNAQCAAGARSQGC